MYIRISSTRFFHDRLKIREAEGVSYYYSARPEGRDFEAQVRGSSRDLNLWNRDGSKAKKENAGTQAEDERSERRVASWSLPSSIRLAARVRRNGEKRWSKIRRRSMRRLFLRRVVPPLQFDLHSPSREFCAPFLKHRAPFVARRAPLNEVNCSKSSWG